MNRRTDPLVPLDDAGRIYELARGLVIADLRNDTEAMHALLEELDIPEQAIWPILCILAHTRYSAVKLAGANAYHDDLVAATATNHLVLRLS